MKRIQPVFLSTLVAAGLLVSGCGAAVGQRGAGSQLVDARGSRDSQGTPVAASSSASAGLPESATPGSDNSSSASSASSGSSGSSASSASSATSEPAQTETPGGMQNGREFVGVVDAINGNQWTLGGQVFTVSGTTEINGTITVGAMVRVHVLVNADGTLTITEIQVADPSATPGWDDSGSPSSAASSSGSTSSLSSTSSSSSSALPTQGSTSGSSASPTETQKHSSGSDGGSGGGHHDGGGNSSSGG